MDLQGFGAFLLVVGGLIFVHEAGHFAVAKALGVKVVRFSIGFGPRLLWLQVGETEYRISALPLGGYVKMAGDVPGVDPEPADRGRGFYEQAPWKRLLIGLAGPAANFVTPVLIFFAAGLVQNGSWTPAAAVGAVAPGSAAERGGLRAGDRIVSIAPPGAAARPLRWWEDLVEVVSAHPGDRLAVVVSRDGRTETLEVVPEPDERFNGVEMETRGVIGITSSWPVAVVAPREPGAAGSLQPFDEVTKVAGVPVRHYGDLARAFAAAACAPVDLEVRRGPAEARAAVALAAVPTCAGGASSVLPVSPLLSAVVGRVEEGSPAAAAGLQRGDVITGFGGRPVRSFRELVDLEGDLKAGVPVELALAGGRTVRVVPREETFKDPATGEKVPRLVLGFEAPRLPPVEPGALDVERVRLAKGAGEIVADGVEETWHLTRLTALGIGKIVTGKISHRQVGGIITLFDQSRDAAAAGWEALLFLMRLVSVNLGLLNLLPIPVLDGGHIAAAAVEQATRRPLSLRVREVATYVGLLLLGLLMILALHNDILRKLG